MMIFVAILAATLAWFVAAAILFFNPVVDKIYRSEEQHPSVRQLPQSPPTIGKILVAIVIQVVVWAWVFSLVAPALPVDTLERGLLFGLILTLTKMLPRDIDRILLTTYPSKRMTIEFIIGVICSFVVGLVFAYLLPIS